jgi:hypothetical protein
MKNFQHAEILGMHTSAHILPIVLYRCETWSLPLRKKHRLRVFGNMVLSEMFGSMREEVTGVWRMLHNEELHHMYSLPNIIRILNQGG